MVHMVSHKTEKQRIKRKICSDCHLHSNLRQKSYIRTKEKPNIHLLNHRDNRLFNAPPLHQRGIAECRNVTSGQLLICFHVNRKHGERNMRIQPTYDYKGRGYNMCNITATRKMYLNGCKNRILDSSPSDVAYTRSHKKYFLQNCTNYPTGCLDDFYGHKRYSTTQFLELQKIDNSNDSFGALEIYGNNKEEINRIFLGNETNILLYVAAFATGFLVVITCLCLFIYLKSTLSKFNFYSSRCLQGIDEFNLREHSFEVINGYNLAELHSKNPHLTKIDDYICEVEIRSSKNKLCEDQEDLNHEVSGSDNEGAKNIIDELFNKIEHIQ